MTPWILTAVAAVAGLVAVGGFVAALMHRGCYRRPLDEPRLDLRLWWAFPIVAIGVSALLQARGPGGPWAIPDTVYAVGGFTMAGIDIDVHRIPNQVVTVWGIVFAVAVTGSALIHGQLSRVLVAAAAAAALALLYLVFNLVSTMGRGDVNLALVTGAALGVHSWKAVYLGTLAAFAVAAVVAVGLLLTKRHDRGQHIAFAPYMVLGALVTLVIGGGT